MQQSSSCCPEGTLSQTRIFKHGFWLAGGFETVLTDMDFNMEISK